MHGHIVPTHGGQATPSLDALAARIRDAHASVLSGFNTATDNAIVAGNLLAAAKADTKQIKHGEWLHFLKRCDVGKRQAQRYMKLAELVDAKATSKSLLIGLSIEQAIRKLSPAKLPGGSVGTRQSGERSKSDKSRVTHTGILGLWVKAPPEERTAALDAIGLGPLVAALPPAWLPAIDKWVADRQQPPAPVTTTSVDPVADDWLPPDLSIPGFLRRMPPPTPVSLPASEAPKSAEPLTSREVGALFRKIAGLKLPEQLAEFEERILQLSRQHDDRLTPKQIKDLQHLHERAAGFKSSSQVAS
jgi:hypothetical protein